MSEPEARDAALRDWVDHVAATDRGRRRPGARHHDYRWRPPLTEARAAALEAELGVGLPAALRRFAIALGDGGVGPFGGVLPIDHPIQRAAAAGAFDPHAEGRALYRGVLGLGHAGCGHLAFVIVRSADARVQPGEVWIDARASGGGVRAIDADFDAYYARWVGEVTHGQPPRGFGARGACSVPAALSHYLHAVEQRAGVASGALSASATRDAMIALPVGAIRIAASGDDPFFTAGDALDPCAACARLLDQLGVPPDRIQPGENPLPARGSGPGSDSSTT